jgi:hypothetical protein
VIVVDIKSVGVMVVVVVAAAAISTSTTSVGSSSNGIAKRYCRVFVGIRKGR